MAGLAEVATLLDVASAIGMAVLSVPAFSLNFRKRTLARISGLVRARRERGDASALDRIAEELRQDSERRVGQWRRADEVCLFAGYFLLLGAAIGRIFV